MKKNILDVFKVAVVVGAAVAIASGCEDDGDGASDAGCAGCPATDAGCAGCPATDAGCAGCPATDAGCAGCGSDAG